MAPRSTVHGVIGLSTNATLNSVVITDPGTRWLIQSNFLVGSNGAGNRLIVSNGGRVESKTVDIGSSLSSNCAVIVTGPGSLWTNATDLLVGRSGSGNLLVVSNGATVWSSAGFLAVSSGSSNNQAVVSGPGSVWKVGQHLALGASGRNNQLLLTDGGSVRCQTAAIGSGAIGFGNVGLVSGPQSL